MTSTSHASTADTSRFIHGPIYHALFDRTLTEGRKRVVDLVPEGARVVDVASGTGELCLELAARKRCHVMGMDLSLRMVEFARKRNRSDPVRFVRRSAVDLSGLEPRGFDFATILLLLHEIGREDRAAVLHEALRVARRVVVVDWQAPLPRNLHGLVIRLVEAVGGREHYGSFADYLATGGLASVLGACGVGTSVVRRSTFWHGCREIVVLDGQTKGGDR